MIYWDSEDLGLKLKNPAIPKRICSYAFYILNLFDMQCEDVRTAKALSTNFPQVFGRFNYSLYLL